jgi:hypothetical protein
MKAVITSIVVAIILALVFSLPALAQESGTITITMTGVNEISISLDKTQWPLGEVAADTECETSPPIQWCTLTVEGNCNVDTLIMGEDATWVSHPDAYKWTLSSDGSNGDHIYGLWFRISGDTTRGPHSDGYVSITKTQSEFWPYPSGSGSSLAPGDTKQFGLKLLTPTYFYGGRQMQTQITISAVAAS